MVKVIIHTSGGNSFRTLFDKDADANAFITEMKSAKGWHDLGDGKQVNTNFITLIHKA